MYVAGVSLPRRRFAHHAAEIARASLPAAVVRHAYRAFVFASLESRRLEMPVKAELLFVSAQFANMGLSSRYAHSQQRYELDGADAARAFLEAEGVRHLHGAAVWNAISLHTTPGLADRMSALPRLLAYGVRADLYGDGIAHVTAQEKRQLLDAFPRGHEFANRYLEAIGRAVLHRPETTFGTLGADVLERISPTFVRGNFCGRVLGARWEIE